MSGIDVRIRDGKGTKNTVLVTSRGQLVSGPIEYSSAFTVTASVINTAFNFVPPVAGKKFVITDLLLDAGKTVSNTTAGTIEVYEATSIDTTTVARSILSVEMLRNTSRTITGINLITFNEGRWVNMKTTDATVTGTLLGYYVSA